MLRILTRTVGVRLVMLVYLAGCLAPSAAMALGAESAICLDEIAAQVQGAAATGAHAIGEHVHVHADGTVHYHADHKAPDPTQAAKKNLAKNELAKDRLAKNDAGSGAPAHSHDDASCCGLFGFSAVLPRLEAPLPTTLGRDLRPLFAADCLSGCGPDRIDRPPIASSSM
jgi:hypothetical protein